MEWMLQVADELDDAAGSIALLWVGIRRGAVLTLMGVVGAVALVAVSVLGIAPSLICASAVLLSAALAFSFNTRFERASN